MVGFFSKFPGARYLPLATCRLHLALDRLKTGVDNIRTDVHFSTDLSSKADFLALKTLIQRSGSAALVTNGPSSPAIQSEISAFKDLCQNAMRDAVNQARILREPQINTLCQVALIKLAVEASESQYEAFHGKLERLLRNREISDSTKQEDFFKLQELIRNVQRHKEILIRDTVTELVEIISKSAPGDLQRIRESSFGEAGQLPDAMLKNPLLNTKAAADSPIMMTHYGLLPGASRLYEKILRRIERLLERLDTEGRSIDPLPDAEDEEPDTCGQMHTLSAGGSGNRRLEPWLLAAENADMLFNYIKSENSYRALKRQKDAGKPLHHLKLRKRHQLGLLKYLKSQFQSKRLIVFITAMPDVETIMEEYCPPLTPEDIVQALISGRGQRRAAARLKQEKGKSKKPLNLKPLREAAGAIRRLKPREVDQRLIAFLERFFRFHRDRVMWERLRDAMERIHLVREGRHLQLSRANNTIYEFLKPDGGLRQSAPVINHVIIKSDLRGSTDITHRLSKAGLNPASFFSLNFFDPITESLAEYGAEKVFIEGDAIILSIFEHDESPEGWYAASRACGLAVRMIQIVRQVNHKLAQTNLPTLEQGIGIGFLNEPPTFLFDGVTRIMISPVINQADRMAGCEKTLRHGLSREGSPFNLEVFTPSTQKNDIKTADDLNLRYNINGIEISEAAFGKVAREIELKSTKVLMTGRAGKPAMVFTGTYPTMSGRFQRLVIRKAPITVINPETLEIQQPTKTFFYEVCTHPGVLKLADTL